MDWTRDCSRKGRQGREERERGRSHIPKNVGMSRGGGDGVERGVLGETALPRFDPHARSFEGRLGVGGGIGISNFECFPAVAGHAHAWIFD